MGRRVGSAVALVLAAALAGCATRALPAAPHATAAASPVLQDLVSVDELAAAFDRDRAHPRIVLLLSPT